ncbi:trehalose-phosphatase [Sphingosinicella soli]|uniref:Trehalose 6-phosphate phosphatase n=1 Tax=Sphingosinicella soli TaxID=333708 RepID=A0A7W7F694_9SPHN|nr:trehalose-phosphatase [Sphingosinicella soli]MBB4631474.1 trehalose 6-phosphate phosphatase [Sphingosinicella soli]
MGTGSLRNANPSHAASLPPPLAAIERPALFLDFDGTLVDLAPQPGAIRLAPHLMPLLEALGRRLEGRLAIVSGRALADLAGHLPAPALTLSGSHGGELRLAAVPADAAGSAFPEAAHLEALAFAAAHGLFVEAKPLGFAMHYRQAPDAERAVQVFADALGGRHGLAVKAGKMVTELMPPGIDKGKIVATLMAMPAFRSSTPVFIGDDVTDEDGFSAAAAARGFGVLVGAPRPTAAAARLADVEAVHAWLGAL